MLFVCTYNLVSLKKGLNYALCDAGFILSVSINGHLDLNDTVVDEILIGCIEYFSNKKDALQHNFPSNILRQNFTYFN